MIYYVEDLADTIKFYHGLLKNNGRLMIIVEAGRSSCGRPLQSLFDLFIHDVIFYFCLALIRKRRLGQPVEDLQE